MPVFKINNSGKRLRDESEETKEVRNRLHQKSGKEAPAFRHGEELPSFLTYILYHIFPFFKKDFSKKYCIITL